MGPSTSLSSSYILFKIEFYANFLIRVAEIELLDGCVEEIVLVHKLMRVFVLVLYF